MSLLTSHSSVIPYLQSWTRFQSRDGNSTSSLCDPLGRLLWGGCHGSRLGCRSQAEHLRRRSPARERFLGAHVPFVDTPSAALYWWSDAAWAELEVGESARCCWKRKFNRLWNHRPMAITIMARIEDAHTSIYSIDKCSRLPRSCEKAWWSL